MEVVDRTYKINIYGQSSAVEITTTQSVLIPTEIIENGNFLLIGDSLLDAFFSGSPSVSLDNYSDQAFINHTFSDLAHGGYSLVTTDGVSAFWNSTTNTESSWYVAARDALVDTTSQQGAFISLGTNDVSRVGTTYTKAQWVAYFESFLAKLCVDFPNLDFIVLSILGRHTTSSVYDFNTVRQAQWDVINNNACGKIYGSYEIYDADIDVSGGVHPSTSGYDLVASRIVEVAKTAINDGSLIGVTGPSISSFDISDETFDILIDLDAATLLTVPADAEDMFKVGLVENGTTLTVSALSVEKLSNTQLSVVFPSRFQGTNPILYYGYNTMYGIPASDAPAIIGGNADIDLPLRLSAHALTFDDGGDVVRLISGLQFDLNPDVGPITYKSGTTTNEVESIGSLNGRVFKNVSAGYNPVIVDNAANGKRGIKASTLGAQLKPDIAGKQNAVRLIVMACIFPASVNGTQILQLGTTAADLQAGFQISGSASGTLTYGRNQANGFTTIKTGINGQKAILALSFDSLSQLRVYYNDPVTPIVTLDPKDNYASDYSLFPFGTSTTNALVDFIILRAIDVYGGLVGGDPTLEDIFTQFNYEYNIGATW